MIYPLLIPISQLIDRKNELMARIKQGKATDDELRLFQEICTEIAKRRDALDPQGRLA